MGFIKFFNSLKERFSKDKPVLVDISPSRSVKLESLKTVQKIVIPQEPEKVEIELPHKYNYQVDNKTIEGIRGTAQCGYTTIAVVLSEDIPEAREDKFIAEMIGLFEKDYSKGKKRRFGVSMNNHVDIYNYYLNKYGIKKRVKFFPFGGTLEDIKKAMQTGSAVEFSGMMTPHGHFMPCVGYSEIKRALKIHDPYAKFDFKKGKYSNQSGEGSWYSFQDFLPYLEKSSLTATRKKGIRMLYLEKI